jgi:hypothetical protein
MTLPGRRRLPPEHNDVPQVDPVAWDLLTPVHKGPSVESTSTFDTTVMEYRVDKGSTPRYFICLNLWVTCLLVEV